MYTDNQGIPRECISDDMLRRMLDGSAPHRMTSSAEMPAQGQKTWGLPGYPLASVYAPLQAFHNLYGKDEALACGTLFAELDLPFEGESIGTNGGGCRG